MSLLDKAENDTHLYLEDFRKSRMVFSRLNLCSKFIVVRSISMAIYAEKKRHTTLDWSILFLLSLAYFALSINIQGFMALMPLLRTEFALSRAQAGFYSSFYFFSATSIAVFTGRIVDHIGAKKGILIGVFSVGILIVLHSFAPNYSMILFLAFFTGIGFSLITPAVNKGVIDAVAPKKRAISMGIMQSGLGFGGFIGASILPLFAQVVGWRQSLILSGSLSLLLGLLLYFFLNLEVQEEEEKKRRETLSLKDVFLVLFSNKKILGLCSLGFVFGTSTSAIIAHFAIYLHQDLGLSLSMAGIGLGILHLGGILGRPGWGFFDDQVFSGERYTSLLFIGIGIGVLALLFSLFTHLSLSYLPLLLFFIFLLGATGMGAQALLFTALAEESGPHTGTATGLSLLFIRLGILSSPPLFGLIADLYGGYMMSWIVLGLFVLGLTTMITVLFLKRGKG